VISLRGNPFLAFLVNKDKVSPERLNRAVRAHGNFSEYVPIFLIMMLVAELNMKENSILLHLPGGIFLIGRLMHAYCFGFLDYSMFLRVGGTALTFTGLCLMIYVDFVSINAL
jgi:hypothetical protein